LWGQRDFSQIDSLIKKMLPEASEVGISVYDLTAKKPLYSYRADKLSRPASTMKLLTAITALSRPDADEPFRTEVWHDGVIEHDTLQGNLYVVGGFDPEFDSQAMDSLIEEVMTFPFSVINGQVYGDVSMKDSLYWGHGWAWDDTPAGYQPYLSPLMFCKGTVQISVFPSAVQGDTASISCKPVSSYYTLTNRTKTRTSSAGKFSFSRDWLRNGNNLVVSGNVTSIRMKESDNLNAEAFLCRLGAQATGKKQVAAEDGIVEIMQLIRQLGHNPKEYKIADGCGLSNYNYLSPALLVDFLKYAYSRTEVFRMLYKSLPVGGIDGTLKNRMKSAATFRNVHAKTGSFTAINTLAGYLKMKNGHEVAFAIMNQNVLSAAKARAFQDKVCEVIIGR